MADTLARQRSIIGSTSAWAAHDLVLGDGELALERTAEGAVRAKVGTGAHKFSACPYLDGGSAGSGAPAIRYMGTADPTAAPPAGAVPGDAWAAVPGGVVAAGWGAPVAGVAIAEGDFLALAEGGAWSIIPATFAAPVYAQRAEYTAGAGETDFLLPSGYVPGYVSVFVNGLKLASDEFTATDGLTVVLATPSMAGDVVALEGFIGASAVPTERYELNLKDYPFNAKGDGIHDDTTAIEMWWQALVNMANVSIDSTSNWRLNQAFGRIPPGDYLYNGTGLTIDRPTQLNEFVIEGCGPETTRISLAPGAYFIKPGPLADMDKFTLRGFQTWGGKGLYLQESTINNVRATYTVENVYVLNFTECGVGHLAPDMPYWMIRRCLMEGALTGTAYTAICILLSGLTDLCLVEGNQLHNYRYGVKLLRGGNSARVRDNAFMRFHSAPLRTSPAVDIWVVPASSYVNSGEGLAILSNKLGNEHFQAGDRQILYAAEDTGSGTNAATRGHLATTAPAGSCISGHVIDENTFFGTGDPSVSSWIYSTVDDVRHIVLGPGNIMGGVPPYLVEFLNADAGDRTARTSTIYAPGSSIAGLETLGPLASNRIGFAHIVDPHGILDDDASAVPLWWGSAVSDPEYTDRLSASITTWRDEPTSWAHDGVTTPITDAGGGSDAVLWELTGPGSILHAIDTLSPGVPCWFEIDIKAPATGTPLPKVTLVVGTAGFARTDYRKAWRIGADWRRRRVYYTPRNSDPVYCIFEAPGAGGVQLGRVKVYQGRHPH